MTLMDSPPHTVTLYRPSYQTDAYGASLETLDTIESSVPAWVFSSPPLGTEQFGRLEEKVSHKVCFATDKSLRPGDRIVVTSAGAFSGKKLKVTSYSERSAGLSRLWVAYCDEDTDIPPSTW